MKKTRWVLTAIALGCFVAGAAAAEEARTFCRFVPERSDDFAWENDKVAFRAYGPALRKGRENSWIDCWLKRVDYPIINKWYKEAQEGKSYHKDHGEGCDPYHVGSSAGCGGTALWLNGTYEPLETFVQHDVILCTPDKSSFKLIYEREIDGTVYGEERTLSIGLGTQLFDMHSIFTQNGQPAAGLPVCIGVTTHDGKAQTFSDRAQGWIACWETVGGGGLGTGAVIDPDRINEIKVVEVKKKDQSHIFILAKTDANGAIDYKAGFGWELAGEIKTADEWKAYLGNVQE